MENVYAILEKKSSLKKYCYRNGYKLERVISEKNVEIDKVLKVLSKHGIKFSNKKEAYKGYYIEVSKGNFFSNSIGYLLNIFIKDSYVSMKIKDSFSGDTEMPFSF